MKLKALEIGSGDAFLIETEEKQILFDSGGSKSKIKQVLGSKKRIDLAICSHNDSDHSNGFIGLLEDPRYEISEIWLPGIWIPVLNFLIENRINKDLIYLLHDNLGELENAREYTNEYYDYNSLVEETEIPIENFDDRLQLISEISDVHLFTNYYSHLNWYNGEFIKLDRIIKIAGLAYRKGSLIRWFKPENNEPSINSPNHSFKSLNSKEIVRIDKVSRKNFFKLLFLTNENKYSLVFEFHWNKIPVILFSADSDYSFMHKKIKYNNIIVTAPHHGSESNSIVYQKIAGDNIIWIRSDRKSKKRPCSDFKKLPERYCLSCSKTNHKEEVCFEFDIKIKKWKWKKGTKCECK